jgi:ankyrin repeat protein
VKYLIKKGIDVVEKTEKGTFVVYYTINNDELEHIIIILVKRGADIEERDISGKICLLRASGYNCRLLVKYLVGRGANVLAKSNGGNTILHLTRVLKYIKLVKYLLNKGASATAVNAARILASYIAIK